MKRQFEWPKGSGVVATYEPHEIAFVNALVVSCEAGDLSREDLKAQVDFLHNTKVMFDARMLTEEEEIERGYRLSVEGHGDFKIPEAAQLDFKGCESG